MTPAQRRFLNWHASQVGVRFDIEYTTGFTPRGAYFTNQNYKTRAMLEKMADHGLIRKIATTSTETYEPIQIEKHGRTRTVEYPVEVIQTFERIR